MKIIKLTSAETGRSVYINIECIGHLYQVPAKTEYGKEKEPAHTRIGVTTHNNGGFKIAEDIDQVMKLIEKAK